jgi:Flp pilus assembly protein TadD
VQGLASRITAAGIFLSLCGVLAACSGVPIEHGVEPLELGKRYYNKGEFGLAEQAFRSAIELNKSDAEAWLGLAASYDRLRRFDQARRAYDVLVKLTGRTPVVLNNLGYHYILQGQYAKANQLLLEARQRDPSNKFIHNNIDLLKARDRSEHAERDG